MLEPYAMKVARTVLRGGKTVRSYLSQLDTLLVHTVNYEYEINIPPGEYKVVIETGPVPNSFGRAGDRFHKAFTESHTPLIMTVRQSTAEVSIDVGTKTIVPAAH